MSSHTSSRREREREARRQAILDAAEQVIRRRGFADTTMDEVASEAELSKGTLYLYFANKDALCAALVERTLQRVRPLLQEVIEEEGRSGLERFLEGLRLEARFIGDNPHLLRMMVSWMLAGLKAPEEDPSLLAYRQAIDAVMRLAVRALSEGQRDGSVRSDLAPFLVALQSWAGLIGVLLMHTSRDELVRRLGAPIDTEAMVELYLSQMARALRPDPGALPAAHEEESR